MWRASGDGREILAVGPVGTFAAGALRYVHHWEKEPAWRQLVRLAQGCRRLADQRASPRTRDLEAVMACAREATWEWPELPRVRGRSSAWLWRLPEDPMRRGMAAMCLSTMLGRDTLQFRPCKQCQEPFARSIKQPGLPFCEVCRRTQGGPTRIYAKRWRTGDPRRRTLDKFEVQMRQWVSRGTITGDHRDRIRDQLVDLFRRQISASALREKLSGLPVHYGPGAREKNRAVILAHFGLHERMVGVDLALTWRVGVIPFDVIFGAPPEGRT